MLPIAIGLVVPVAIGLVVPVTIGLVLPIAIGRHYRSGLCSQSLYLVSGVVANWSSTGGQQVAKLGYTVRLGDVSKLVTFGKIESIDENSTTNAAAGL